MEFPVGVELTHEGVQVKVLQAEGHVRAMPLEALVLRNPRAGGGSKPLPKAVIRDYSRLEPHYAKVDFVSRIDKWEKGSAKKYCAGLSIEPPPRLRIEHEVFRRRLPKGLTLHVPAFVLMEALFRPNFPVLSAAFTPVNIDRLAFLDFVDGKRAVRCMYGSNALPRRSAGTGLERHLEWLHSSDSARASAQSVHTNAMHGRLGLTRPNGRFNLQARGVQVGRNLYVTKILTRSVRVDQSDSLAGVMEPLYLLALGTPLVERLDLNTVSVPRVDEEPLAVC